MKYIDALDHLDALGERLAFRAVAALDQEEWRMFVRPRGDSGTCQVELQHREDRCWFSVANVSVSVSFEGGSLLLRTYISCTMCGRWRDDRARAKGLRELFDVADAFEEFTAGKTFES